MNLHRSHYGDALILDRIAYVVFIDRISLASRHKTQRQKIPEQILTGFCVSRFVERSGSQCGLCGTWNVGFSW